MIELNNNGKCIWYRYNGRITLEKSYRWVDNLILIDESNNRRVITDFKYSTFDFTDWTPMNHEQYKLISSGKKLWDILE